MITLLNEVSMRAVNTQIQRTWTCQPLICTNKIHLVHTLLFWVESWMRFFFAGVTIWVGQHCWWIWTSGINGWDTSLGWLRGEGREKRKLEEMRSRASKSEEHGQQGQHIHNSGQTTLLQGWRSIQLVQSKSQTNIAPFVPRKTLNWIDVSSHLIVVLYSGSRLIFFLTVINSSSTIFTQPGHSPMSQSQLSYTDTSFGCLHWPI